MSPQNWLCRSERNPALDTLASISPLGHLNGDNAYSPQIPDTKLMVTSKIQFLQLQHLSSKIQLILSLTRPTTHAAFSTFLTFSLLTIYSTRVLQHQKQTKYSMLQIKNFLCCVVKKKCRYSFVLPKKYSVREINNFPKHYMGISHCNFCTGFAGGICMAIVVHV